MSDKPEGNDKPEVPTEQNQGIPESQSIVKRSFATQEQAQAATQPPTNNPKTEEEKAKEEMEHPYLVLVRLVNSLCLLVEQQKKSADALIERFDKFFSIFESLAKPKSPAPTIVPSPSASAVPASTPVPEPTPSPAPTPAPVQQTVSQEVEEKIIRIKNQLGPEFTSLLSFDVNKSTNYIIISPTSYLGNERFSKIATILRDNGGEYVSAGRASHFQVPKFEAKK